MLHPHAFRRWGGPNLSFQNGVGQLAAAGHSPLLKGAFSSHYSCTKKEEVKGKGGVSGPWWARKDHCYTTVLLLWGFRAHAMEEKKGSGGGGAAGRARKALSTTCSHLFPPYLFTLQPHRPVFMPPCRCHHGYSIQLSRTIKIIGQSEDVPFVPFLTLQLLRLISSLFVGGTNFWFLQWVNSDDCLPNGNLYLCI